MRIHLKARLLPAYVMALALTAIAVAFWGTLDFYFPSLRSGIIITVPLALVLALVPGLMWALTYDLSRFEMTRTSLRTRTLAVVDVIMALVPACALVLVCALAGEASAGRNVAIFLGMVLLGQGVNDRYYVFLLPTLYLLCCLSMGWAYGSLHPDWWALPIDSLESARDWFVSLALLATGSAAFLRRRLRE